MTQKDVYDFAADFVSISDKQLKNALRPEAEIDNKVLREKGSGAVESVDTVRFTTRFVMSLATVANRRY